MTQQLKVAFFDAKPYDIDSFESVNSSFGYKLRFHSSHISPDNLGLVLGYDAVCAFVNDQITADVISGLVKSGVKLIALRSAGYNNVDLKAAYQHIHVVRVPAYSPYAVAEHALALILSVNRKIHRAYYRTRDYNFSLNGLLGFDMYKKTIGVIGTGKIGKVFIELLRGFNMNVLAYDNYPDQSYAEQHGFCYTALDDLYAQSDIISLHCPLTEETTHLINAETISKMKQGVIIINTSRGKLIDSVALINALRDKKIGAAALDVYEEESEYFFEDHSSTVMSDDVLARLISFSNVLVTSHQAFFTHEALENIAQTTMQNISTFFDGTLIENEICYHCDKAVCSKKETGRCW